MMASPDWLTACPIAHRGLHNRDKGIIENTLGAARAAINHGFSIECDVQMTADGEIIVFHDDDVDRLTTSQGNVASKNLSEIKSLKLKDTDEDIPTLDEFLSSIASSVPLVCEIKSNFDGNMIVVERCCKILSQYPGPVAIKSFDPDMISRVRNLAPDRPRGFIGESRYDDPEWDSLGQTKKKYLISLSHFSNCEPDFLSWYHKDLEQLGPCLSRSFIGLPLMTWTIRSQEASSDCLKLADQIVFENFLPNFE
jgi:glycerophosphoryl diester phosphodiesterase